MYSRATVDLALVLSGLDILDRENALICGVSVQAIRHWRRGNRRSELTERARCCLRCDGRTLDATAYAYLLGLYLGDGHITLGRRGACALAIYCGDTWPGLADAAEHLGALAVPFPQHGPGRKHERKIELESWQQAIVTEHAGDFARGLFHSDGYRGINRVRRTWAGRDRWYEYPRYLFDNHSTDILRLCGETLDRLGVDWRYSKPTTISVARRDAVARLDEFIGPTY